MAWLTAHLIHIVIHLCFSLPLLIRSSLSVITNASHPPVCHTILAHTELILSSIPISDLTRNGEPENVQWSLAAGTTFKILETALRTVLILRNPEFDLPFLVYTNPSNRPDGLCCPTFLKVRNNQYWIQAGNSRPPLNVMLLWRDKLRLLSGPWKNCATTWQANTLTFYSMLVFITTRLPAAQDDQQPSQLTTSPHSLSIKTPLHSSLPSLLSNLEIKEHFCDASSCLSLVCMSIEPHCYNMSFTAFYNFFTSTMLEMMS